MPGKYGINHREFEQLTGLREGDEVEYQMGIDSPMFKGKIAYSWVGAGFDVVQLHTTDDKYQDTLHFETSYGLWNSKPKPMMIYYKGKRIV